MSEIRVALIEDDTDVRDALSGYLTARGLYVIGFACVEDFAASTELPYDIIVSDVRMPGLSGLHLQGCLAKAGDTTPMILITGHGSIAMAVTAIKAGAYDFIEKPFDAGLLLHRIKQIVGQRRQGLTEQTEVEIFRARILSLPKRQREVLALCVRGVTSKEIATELGISPRTVDEYRSAIMEKLEVKNILELVRLVTWVEARTSDSPSGA